MRRRDFITAMAGSAIAWPVATHAARWPTQLVRIICPLAAGGGIDATARIVAARLSEIWGQQVVVENKSGASGNIAAELVARSDPDGYTIYIASFPHATNSYLYPALGYDPVADFAPVTLIGLYPLMMVVPNSSPAHSVKEFIAYAKASKLSYASSGHGTSLHLAGELFKRRAGIEMTHVPYRGAGPAFNDLIPGRVDAMINFTASSLPLARQGQLRGLAVASARRLEVAPDLPTMAEAGVAGVEVSYGRRSSSRPRRPGTSSGKFTTTRSQRSPSQRSEERSNKAAS
jgi:tripartite-type tricarboxylate transporter receptor subunit TctC